VQAAADTTAPPSIRSHRRSARRWLVVVGAAYAVVQLSSLQLDRAPSWDEAIYLSQVTPGAAAYNFTASRARGITFLVAPFAVTRSLPVVRAGLAVAAAIALVGAFWPWVPTIGAAAPAGAAAVASSWTTLFYGSEVMPNLWVALAGLAALGFATGPRRAEGHLDDLAAALLLAAAALLRPFDAIVLAAAAVGGALLVARRSGRTAGILVAGVAAGCLPWFVEVTARYGGVGEAFAQAIAVAHVSVPGPWERVLQYLAMVKGPTIGPVADPGIPVIGVAIVGLAATLAALGIVEGRRTGSAGPAAAALGGAVLLAAAYVGFVGGVAPRFLLPAIALVSVAVGTGLVAVWRRAAGTVPRTVFVALVAAWTVWQVGLAVRWESAATRQRGDVEVVGRRIASANDGRRCVVASIVGAPQLGYASGCRGRAIVDVGTVDQVLTEEARRGVARVFLVLRQPLERPPPGTSLRWTMGTAGTGPIAIERVDIGGTVPA
jgi:hypothetical protein